MLETQSFISSRKSELYGQLFSSLDQALGFSEVDYAKYQRDPVGFARDVLAITVTDDIGKVLKSVRDNRITVARSCTGPGKSHGAASIAVWFYKCFKDSKVYTVANPYENQEILWGEISHLVTTNPAVFANDKIVNFRIEKSSINYIRALTVPTTGTDEARESKFSGKHAPCMLFIVDEGDVVPGFAYKGIEGCMSGGLIIRLLILFNPRHETGAPYRHERDGTANVIHLSAFNHPNVITGEQIIPGAVDRHTTVQRINMWCRPLNPNETPDGEAFELPSFLVGAVASDPANKQEYPPLAPGYYKIMNPAFAYMVLGQYPAQAENQLISKEWLARARSRWDAYVAVHGEVAPSATQPKMGLDVAEMGIDLNVRCLRYGGWVPKLKTWGKMDPVTTGEIGTEEYEKHNAIQANVDGTGVGAGVAPQMRRKKCNAYSIKVASKPTEVTDMGEFRILRDQLWWACREWLRTDPGAMLPPDEELIEELQTPTYRVKNGKIEVMPKEPTEGWGDRCIKKLLQRSSNKADSLTLTFADANQVYDPLDLQQCFH